MVKGILGRKVGMTQILQEDGTVVPVTVIEAGPCYVTQVRTPERDGYRAVQLGYEPAKPKHLTKGQMGHLDKGGVPYVRHLREVRIRADEAYEVGQEIRVDIFEPGERVDVVGRSKGRGFAGVVRRWHFAGGPRTHGQSDRERAPGSIGACATPGKVWKGQKMPGHMGNKRTTVQNLEVVLVDAERNLLAVRGSVPGPKGGLVLIKSGRKQKVAKGG
ncbi:MAG TPA: 50S ribosomal protein L3 [Chloroflexi bacterium]|nr:50S ribosomal protein L3 [Chloroflexota bacterium]